MLPGPRPDPGNLRRGQRAVTVFTRSQQLLADQVAEGRPMPRSRLDGHLPCGRLRGSDPPFRPGDPGGPNASVKKNLKAEGSPDRHEAVAAELQSVIAYTVKSRVKIDGRNLNAVAASAGMDYKRLYRLLTGQTWIKLADVVGLSYVLGIDLARIYEYRGKKIVSYRRAQDALSREPGPLLQPHQRGEPRR